MPAQGGQGVAVAGDNHGGGGVDRGQAGPALVGGECPGYGLFAGLHREHGAAGGQGLHETAAGGDRLAGIRQGPHPRGMRGGQFAHRMPEQEVRRQAPVFQQPEQGHFQGEQCGLGIERLVQQPGISGAGTGPDHLPQRTLQMLIEVGAHLVPRGCEHREGRMQSPAHAQTLRTLPGEQERHLARRTGSRSHTGDHTIVPLTGSQLAQPLQQLLTVPPENHRTLFEPRPRHSQRPAHIHRPQPRTPQHMRPQPHRLLPHRTLPTPRNHPRHHHRHRPRHRHHHRPRRTATGTELGSATDPATGT